MGTVVGQDGGRRTAVNYYEALNKHPIVRNSLPRILMAAFAPVFDKGLTGFGYP